MQRPDRNLRTANSGLSHGVGGAPMRSRAPKDTGFLFACVIWLAACGTSSPSSTPPATGSGAGSQAPSATPSASPVSSDPSVAFPLDIVDAEGKSHHFNEPVTS